MLGSIIAWAQGMSVVARVALGVASVGVAGTAAGVVFPAVPQHSPATTQKHTVKPAPAEKPKPVESIQTTTETLEVPYSKKTVESSTLNKGESAVTTKGVNGVRTVTYKVTALDGLQVKREEVSSEITTQPVDEVMSVGTYVAPVPAPRPAPAPSNCDPNYSPCVPLVSYDLDCPDIGFRVQVIGSDPHRFDGNRDGVGCEAY